MKLSQGVGQHFNAWINRPGWNSHHQSDNEKFYVFVKAVARYNRKKAPSWDEIQALIVERRRDQIKDIRELDRIATEFAELYQMLLNYEKTKGFPNRGIEYEGLVQDIVRELRASTQALGTCKVEDDPRKRVHGASGFKHQIDVTVSNPPDLLLIECKCLTEPVDAGPVLVLAARICDIRAARPGTRVHGSIVSMREVSSGARVLAKYFGIEIDTVRSPREYAIRVFNHIFTGLLETAQATDTANADVTRGNGG